MGASSAKPESSVHSVSEKAISSSIAAPVSRWAKRPSRLLYTVITIFLVWGVIFLAAPVFIKISLSFARLFCTFV